MGPGAGSFMASAAELSALAAAITEMLGGDEAVAAALGFAWPAPTGDMAVLANVPYLLWQAASAMMLAEHAGKIEATASAFETLKAATPTPAEVETNQVTHGILQATNFCGINSGAIAANRAQYFGDYWLRSASNKYSYAAASAAGVQSIEPLPPPLPTTMPMTGADPGQGGDDPSGGASSPMQMLMPLVSQLGQVGQMAGSGGSLSSLMSLPQQALQPLMSMSSSAGGLSAPGAGVQGLEGAGWLTSVPSAGGPVSASLSAGGAAAMPGAGSGAATVLRGPVSWSSATVPVSAQAAAGATAPAAAAVSAGSTAPAGMGGGAMMGAGAMAAAARGGEDEQRDAQRSAEILSSVARLYREPVAVPVVTGNLGALFNGKGSTMG